jgi:tRNA A37 methylthiotransferase MiaB
VPDTLKRERFERLTELQRVITGERYERRLGTVARAVVDRPTPAGSQARLPWQADDIDGVTHLDELHPPGTFLDVAVEEVVEDYDFRASVVSVVPGRRPPKSHRSPVALPVLQPTIGSYGR